MRQECLSFPLNSLQSCGKVTVRVRAKSAAAIELIRGVDDEIDEDQPLVRFFGDRVVDIGFADFVRYRITENIDNLPRFKGTVEILCEGLEVVDCSTCSRLSSSGAGSSANRNGCFKFTPAPNFHGEVLFKYTAAIDDPNGKFINAPSPMGVRITVSIEHSI